MAVKLMHPSGPPVEHRLSHDLESLCMVLLHIVRFMSGPVSASVTKPLFESNRVLQWHAEVNINILRDLKRVDLQEMAKRPEVYITKYWAPIAPYITKLLKTIYPRVVELKLDSSTLTKEAFKSVLVKACDHCVKLSKIIPNYAAISDTSWKCSRPNDSHQDHRGHKHLCQLDKDQDLHTRSCNAHVMPSTNYGEPAFVATDN